MPRSRQRFSNPSAVQQLPRSVRMRVTRKGKAAIASSRKALAAASVSSSLTARWTRRERRSMATNRKRLRHSPSAVRSLGRCFTSTWTKPSSYSLNLLAGVSGSAGAGRRPRPAALRMRETLSRPRCGRKRRTTKVRSSSGKPVARRKAHTTARSSSLAFQGSLCGRLERSLQSSAPRLRHLRTVSVLTPKRLASSPLGSLERAISARTAGVVRALGWIESIRPFLLPGAPARGRRSARRTPRSPNVPDPNTVPQPEGYRDCVIGALSARRPRLRLLAVHLGRPAGRDDVGDRRLELVLPAGDDVALAVHHRLEAALRDVGRVVLLRGAELGVHHVGALEELGLGRPRHQAADGDAGVRQLVADGEGEGIEERFASVVDRLVGAGHEAGDRAGDQDAALAARAHVAADLVDQVDRAGDVGVDDAAHLGEVLVEEALAEAAAGVGEERLDRPALRGGVELVYALERREVGLHSVHGGAELAE